MKGCPKKEEWVLYVAGEAPHRRRRALEVHLESCGDDAGAPSVGR